MEAENQSRSAHGSHKHFDQAPFCVQRAVEEVLGHCQAVAAGPEGLRQEEPIRAEIEQMEDSRCACGQPLSVCGETGHGPRPTRCAECGKALDLRLLAYDYERDYYCQEHCPHHLWAEGEPYPLGCLQGVPGVNSECAHCGADERTPVLLRWQACLATAEVRAWEAMGIMGDRLANMGEGAAQRVTITVDGRAGEDHEAGGLSLHAPPSISARKIYHAPE